MVNPNPGPQADLIEDLRAQLLVQQTILREAIDQLNLSLERANRAAAKRNQLLRKIRDLFPPTSA